MTSMAEKTKVVCWGKKRYGFCDVPEDLGEVKQIAAGGSHSMALLADGTVRFSGLTEAGDGPKGDLPTFLGHEVKQIAADANCVMALLADGTVLCWELHNNSQCDVPEDLGEVKQIAAGGGIFDTNCMALVVLA